jgi:hypothetical protein
MQLYGLMITKDDEAIFADWCRDQLHLYEAVICLDGSATDATAHIASGFSERLLYFHERDSDIPHKTDHGLRAVVHREIVRRFGTGNWVMCCHADEFCYHDPRKLAALAERQGFDLVSWYSLHFLPHPSELTDWRTRQKLPVPERHCHYHWSYRGDGLPWCEDRLYCNRTVVSWDGVTHGSVRPHGLARMAPFHPILQHYKVFTTDLAWYEAGGRSTFYRSHWTGTPHRTGLAFSVRRLEDLFVSAIPDYARCDRFDGTFRHSWNMGEEYRPESREHLPPLR